MTLDNIMNQRTIKACYMGFIMSRECNDYLGKLYQITKNDLIKFISVFNNSADFNFNKIIVEYDDEKWGKSIRIRTIGESFLLNSSKTEDLLDKIERLINTNLKLATTRDKHIQIFDLNTFDELDRVTWNTMGDKYLASNKKRYMVNFIHLYSIGDI